MQLHEEPSSEPKVDLPQRRVTPEELSRALAAIEARQQEAAQRQEETDRYLAETIPVDEAVRELNLPTTPEEIWAEVQAQRETAIKEQPEESLSRKEVPPKYSEDFDTNHATDTEIFRTPVRSTKRAKAGITGIIGVAILAGILVWFSPSVRQQPTTQSLPALRGNIQRTLPIGSSGTPVLQTLDTEFSRRLAYSRGPHPIYQATLVRAEMEVRTGETPYPDMVIPDGYSIYETPFTIGFSPNQIAIVFRSAGETKVELNRPGDSFKPFAPVFAITRYNGREYLRGWIAKAEKSAIQHGGSTTVYTSLSGAPRSLQIIPITIPLSNSSPSPGNNNNDEGIQIQYEDMKKDSGPEGSTGYRVPVMIGDRIKLDQHAWEDFPNLRQPRYVVPAWIKQGKVFSNHPDLSRLLPIYSDFDASSVVEPIKEVPNGRPFRCGQEIMQQIAQSRFPDSLQIPDILVDTRPDLWRPFHLIKHDNNLYLRGWVPSRIIEQQANRPIPTIYNDSTDPLLGATPTQITLCLKGCLLMPSVQYTTVTNFHLDKYAWEKWSP